MPNVNSAGVISNEQTTTKARFKRLQETAPTSLYSLQEHPPDTHFLSVSLPASSVFPAFCLGNYQIWRFKVVEGAHSRNGFVQAKISTMSMYNTHEQKVLLHTSDTVPQKQAQTECK